MPEQEAAESKRPREWHPIRAKIAGASGVAPGILRIDGVMARTGLARSTIYLRLKEDPQFPKPIPLGRVRGWLAAEVDEWIADRVREARGKPAAA